MLRCLRQRHSVGSNYAMATGFSSDSVIFLSVSKHITQPCIPGNTGGRVQVGVGPGVHDDDVRPLRGGEDGRGARAEAVFGGGRLGGRGGWGRRAGTKVHAEAVAGPLGGVVHAQLLREAEEGAQLGPRTQPALRILGKSSPRVALHAPRARSPPRPALIFRIHNMEHTGSVKSFCGPNPVSGHLRHPVLGQ